MVVAAIATIFNEADIIGTNLRHLAAEGVDLVLLALGPSTDDTNAIVYETHLGGSLEALETTVMWVQDNDPIHHQPQWINFLAAQAVELGAEWIIPFDADEFVYATHGHSTVAEALDDVPAWAHAVMMPQYRHVSWNVRQDWRTLPKIAMRSSVIRNGARITNGNHALTEGVAVGESVLAMRELHYRGFDHFVRKTRERCATIDPTLPDGDGAHQLRYRGMNEAELWLEWLHYLGNSAVYLDPIPSRLPYAERVSVSQ